MPLVPCRLKGIGAFVPSTQGRLAVPYTLDRISAGPKWVSLFGARNLTLHRGVFETIGGTHDAVVHRNVTI